MARGEFHSLIFPLYQTLIFHHYQQYETIKFIAEYTYLWVDIFISQKLAQITQSTFLNSGVLVLRETSCV